MPYMPNVFMPVPGASFHRFLLSCILGIIRGAALLPVPRPRSFRTAASWFCLVVCFHSIPRYVYFFYVSAWLPFTRFVCLFCFCYASFCVNITQCIYDFTGYSPANFLNGNTNAFFFFISIQLYVSEQ